MEKEPKSMYYAGKVNENALYRCQTCGKLLTAKMNSRGICAGHKLIFATEGTIREYLKWKLGLLR